MIHVSLFDLNGSHTLMSWAISQLGTVITVFRVKTVIDGVLCSFFLFFSLSLIQAVDLPSSCVLNFINFI